MKSTKQVPNPSFILGFNLNKFDNPYQKIKIHISILIEYMFSKPIDK